MRKCKLVKYTDKLGFIRQSFVPADYNGDPAAGIPCDPPNLDELNLSFEKQRDLHNNLVNSGLITQADVFRLKNGVSGILARMGLGHLRKQLIQIYRRV